MKRRQTPGNVDVPEWSGFGIGHQLHYGETFGGLFEGATEEHRKMPSEAVLRAAWEHYRDRFEGETAWAGLVFDQGMTPDDARAHLKNLQKGDD